MKNLKSTKGFTLVELIVVIAILGILAAVAVPAYSGYMTKAKEAGDMQILSSVATAVQGVAAGHEVKVTTIVVTKSTGAIDVTSDPDDAWKSEYLTEATKLLGGSVPTDYEGDWTKATMTTASHKWDLTYSSGT